jgi:hypothetical protein
MPETIQIALIAGISALLGGLLANWNARSLHKMDEAKALRQVHREKLEHILKLLGDTMGWFLELSRARTLEELSSLSQCPEAREAYNLACLYFSEIRVPIGEYADSLIGIHDFLIDAFDPTSPLSAGGDAARHSNYTDAIDHVKAKRMRAEDLIGKIAKSYNDVDSKK